MAHPSMLPKIMQCQQILSYYFADQNLCWEALQMAGNGITSAGPRRIGDGNKRLAILGDQVLGLVLSQDWYRGGAMLGIWTSIRQRMLTNAKLASVGKEKHLDDCVQLGNGQSMPLSTNMMATTVQALVGAVYLDGVGGGEGGIEAARGVMRSLGLVDES